MSTPDGPERVEPEDGHEIAEFDLSVVAGYETDARCLLCTCGWVAGVYRMNVDTHKQLHWLAKKIEREVLNAPDA